MEMNLRLNRGTKKREADFDKVRDSCFIVRWLRIHCFINPIRNIFRPLTKKDFFNTTSDLHPEVNFNRYCELVKNIQYIKHNSERRVREDNILSTISLVIASSFINRNNYCWS
jgi:hypothetical protein